MEVLVFILIIIFISVSGNKNKKKQGQSAVKGAPNAKAVANPKAASRVKAAPRVKFPKQDEVTKMLSDWLDDAAVATAAAKAPAEVRPVKVAGQQSPVFMATSKSREASILDEVDDEGCVGGSMAHTHEEGESRAEHARHVREARQREVRESMAAQAATELSELNLQRLRQAVVMAEILDRPKALRRVR